MRSCKPVPLLEDSEVDAMGVKRAVKELKIAKNDPLLKRIPVAVMTTSREEQDRLESFSCCIAGYMQKPIDYKRLVEMI